MNKQIIRISLVSLLLSLAVLAPLFAEKKLPHYNIVLDVNPETGSMNGKMLITIPQPKKLKNTEKKIYLVLLLNAREKRNPHLFRLIEDRGVRGFTPSKINISNVKINGKEASWDYRKLESTSIINFNLQHLLCEISIPADAKSSGDIRLEFEYESLLPNIREKEDFYFKNLMISRFGWLPVILPPGSSPDNISMTFPFFTYEAEIKLPGGWKMAAQGSDFRHEKQKYLIKNNLPVCSFLLAFMKNYHVYETGSGNKKLRVYCEKGLDGNARLISTYAKDVLAYYDKNFFPVDYKNISIVQGTPGFWGIASDSVIVLGDGAFNGADRGVPGYLDPFIDYLVSHELGHFYFGIGTPPDYIRENYLSEGLTEFASLGYIEKRYGSSAVNKYKKDLLKLAVRLLSDFTNFRYSLTGWRFKKYLSCIYEKRQGWETPLSKEPEDTVLNVRSVNDYDRSFYIFNMLENYLGQDDFIKALGMYAKKNHHKNVTSESLKKFLEKYYNVDLTLFFETFILGKKTIDYDVSGEKNYKYKNGKYFSKFNIAVNSDIEIFIPVTLSVFLQNGKELEFPVTGTGIIDVESEEKVSYVTLDKNLSVLDYNRINNSYPKKMVYSGTRKYWLRNNGAIKWGFYPIIDPGEDDNFYMGMGIRFYKPHTWTIFSSHYAEIPDRFISQKKFAEIKYGTVLGTAFSFPGWNSLSIFARITDTNTLAKTGLTYKKSFYVERNVGMVGHFYYPVYSLSVSSGIGGIGFDKENPYVSGNAVFEIDNLIKSATFFKIENELNYYYLDKSFENRLSGEYIQGFSFIKKTLLSLRLSGQTTFGTISELYAKNPALGWKNNCTDLYPYGFSAKAFFGFPVINNIELSIFNLGVLQSINAGIVYEFSTAFSDGKGFGGNSQQAIGLEVFPWFRTLKEQEAGFGIGISFNITKIANAPRTPVSYSPCIFLDFDLIPLIYPALISY